MTEGADRSAGLVDGQALAGCPGVSEDVNVSKCALAAAEETQDATGPLKSPRAALQGPQTDTDEMLDDGLASADPDEAHAEDEGASFCGMRRLS